MWIGLFAFMALFCFGESFAETTISESVKASDQDTSIVIKKGKSAEDAEYEIISDTAEITGDPSSVDKNAYNSWKEARDQWKKDLRDSNKNNEVLAMDCSQPTAVPDKDSITIYRATCKYKIKVRMRSPGK